MFKNNFFDQHLHIVTLHPEAKKFSVISAFYNHYVHDETYLAQEREVRRYQMRKLLPFDIEVPDDIN